MKKYAPAPQLTDLVFQILRHAQALAPGANQTLWVCWGGHSINDIEYDYTKKVGYELGLRGYEYLYRLWPRRNEGAHERRTYSAC